MEFQFIENCWMLKQTLFKLLKVFLCENSVHMMKCLEYHSMPNKSSRHLGKNQYFWRFSKISWHFLKIWVGLKIWPSWKKSSFFGKFSYLLLIFLFNFYRVTNPYEKLLIFAHFLTIFIGHRVTPMKKLLIFAHFPAIFMLPCR